MPRPGWRGQIGKRWVVGKMGRWRPGLAVAGRQTRRPARRVRLRAAQALGGEGGAQYGHRNQAFAVESAHMTQDWSNLAGVARHVTTARHSVGQVLANADT